LEGSIAFPLGDRKRDEKPNLVSFGAMPYGEDSDGDEGMSPSHRSYSCLDKELKGLVANFPRLVGQFFLAERYSEI